MTDAWRIAWLMRLRKFPKLREALGDQLTRVVRGEERDRMQRQHEDLEARLLKRK